MASGVDREGEGSGGRLGAWLPLLVFAVIALLSFFPWRRLDQLQTSAGQSLLDEFLLACGLVAGALLALAIHLRRQARLRAVQAERALAQLRERTEESERARGALDAVERELGDIFESISDAFYTLDREWRFTLLNPRACQLMRLPRESLQGHVVWDVFPEVVGSEIERQFRLAATESRTVEFEIHFPPLETWFSVRVYPHPNGLAVYFQDIGDRKRAELALVKARAASERAQRLARLGSWEYDLRTGRLAWSEEVLRIFGMTPGQLERGLPALLERVHADDRPALVEAQRRLHSGEDGASIDIEYRVQRADGQVRVVRELGTLIRDDDGQPAFATGALQDITERRHNEDALLEATRRLEQSLVMTRLVMDNSLDVICALDANGRFAKVSGASERIWGYAWSELVGRDHLDLVHPDEREASRAMAASVMAGEATTDFRNRIVRKDGRVVVMQWSAVWSARDRLFFAVARDITEAERQSRALMDAKESLQRAQKVARMGAWELDIASNMLTWSDDVYQMFQVERDEFAGTFEAFAARVHPDDLPVILAAQARALAGEADLDIEHRILLPGGAVGYVHERARLVRDAEGQPLLLAGSVQDVTERKRQQALLLESGRRMRATVDSALDCIVAMDAEGRIIEFNPAAEATFGYRREQAIGQSLADLIVPPAYRAAHAEGLRRHQATGEARVLGRRMEMPALRADGSEIQVELSITPMSDEGVPTFVGFMRDVTQARRARLLEEGQREILAGIAARKPLADSLEALARLCERQLPGALCAIQLMDPAGERLLSGAAPSLPETFVLALHGARIGPAQGSCGTAAYSGLRVVVSDIANDPLWVDYAVLAAEHGLRACWSIPVKGSDGRVLATFANYHREVRTPTADELAVVEGLASLAAVAIEQAHAYRAIDLSEQRFRSLFEEHPDAVFSLDEDGRFTAYNGQFRLFAGGRADALLGMDFQESIALDQRDVARAHFHAALRGEARTYETTAIAAGGTRLDIRVTNLPIVVEGRVTGVFGIAQDITLLRKHQRDLAQALDAAEANSQQLHRLGEAAITINRSIGASDLFQQLADTLRHTIGAHQALVALDPQGGASRKVQAVSLSDKYAQWRDETVPLAGNSLYSIVCETNRPMRLSHAELESHPRWRSFCAEVGRHPPMRGWLAVPLVASDGSNRGVLQVSDRTSGDFTQDDELVAVQFAQVASIAIERAELIEKLVVRERFFQLSLEIFVIYDPAIHRWRQVNPVFCRITGYSAEELCGRDFRDFIHPDDVPATSDRSSRLAARDDVPLHFENRYVCRDGSIRWIEWVSVLGPDQLVYGVGRDITQRREAELALRQTLVDLGHRNRELQDFAFIASHDLQEPLRKIRAFSERLQQRHADVLPPEARDYLDRSHQAAARMQTLIGDLLAYSRVAARGKPFARVDVGGQLAAVIEDMEATLEASGGRIEAGPLPALECDPIQLRQLLQNLLSNALKFRSPDRPPVVRVSAAACRLADEAAWELRFEDNGIGFEARYAEKIFGPFQRLHGREAYEGSGIGLAIVRRIVERHRGTIAAEGRIGDGATFIVVLPESQPGARGVSTGPFSEASPR